MRRNFELTPFDLEKEKLAKKQALQLKKDVALLKEIHQERLANTKSQKAKTDITIGTQFLICHYLGLLSPLPSVTNDKKAILLSQIFNVEGFENLRQRFSNIHHKDSFAVQRKNLAHIKDLFNKLGLNELEKAVEKDLIKLTKK